MKPDRDARAQRCCTPTDLLLRQGISDRRLVPSESVISLRCNDGRYHQRRNYRYEPFSGLVGEGRCLAPPRILEYDQKLGWLMRFCKGIPNDRYRIVADEHCWQAGYASPFRDGRGVHRLPSRCCGARLVRPHLPLPHGERKGGRGGLVRTHGGPRTQ